MTSSDNLHADERAVLLAMQQGKSPHSVPGLSPGRIEFCINQLRSYGLVFGGGGLTKNGQQAAILGVVTFVEGTTPAPYQSQIELDVAEQPEE